MGEEVGHAIITVMPSVILSWEATCAKPAVQWDLSQRLVPIADHFDRFVSPPTRSPRFGISPPPALELRHVSPVGSALLGSRRASLAGPGFFYPGEDLVSFVFLSAEGIPLGAGPRAPAPARGASPLLARDLV